MGLKSLANATHASSECPLDSIGHVVAQLLRSLQRSLDVFGKQRGIGSSDANFKQIVAFVKDSFARYRFKLETIASCRVRALEQVASNGTDTSRKQRSIEDHELSYPHPCMER